MKVKWVPNHIWNPEEGYVSQNEVRITEKEAADSVMK